MAKPFKKQQERLSARRAVARAIDTGKTAKAGGINTGARKLPGSMNSRKSHSIGRRR